MPKQKHSFAKAALAVVMALSIGIPPVTAHTVAIGYVIPSPGDVTVWFGTYHDFTEMPTTEGQALLILPDASQISVPFTLTSMGAPAGLGSNVVFSQTHINMATGLPYTLSELPSWEGAPFTGLTEVGTYTVELNPMFPPTSQKWDNDVGNITFTINPNITGLQIPVAGLTDNQKGVLQGINHSMANGGSSGSFTRLDIALMRAAGNSMALGQELDQMSPIKFGNFASTTAFNNEDFETAAEDMYLENLRNGPQGGFAYGNGQIDASGLTVNDPNVDPGLQMVHSRMLAWNAPSGLVSDVVMPALGGIDMKDTKSLCSSCPAYNNPWNVFVRGNVVLAQGYSQSDIPHFDDTTSSVVLGTDYRFTSKILAGATLGFAHTDVTLDSFNSSATVDSYTPGIYAAYADHGWFANFQGRYSYNSYTQSRNIDFLHQTANSAASGDEGVLDLDGGYEFHSGNFTYGPTAGVQYVHLTVNGYSESGTDANLRVENDQSDSLRSRLGGAVKYDFKGWGAVMFSPHLNVSWEHEFMDQSRGITSAFTNFNGGSFVVRTQDASDDFALVDAGLDAKLSSTVTLFGDYMVQAGQSNYFGQSVQAGVKVNF